MLEMKKRRPAIRSVWGWAIGALLEAGAIRECEEHGWMRNRSDPLAGEASRQRKGLGLQKPGTEEQTLVCPHACGCSRKKRSISFVASGPSPSV
jgi:hypothetical protein